MVKYLNFKDQDFKTLKDECVNVGHLFEDVEFPATNRSLSYSTDPPKDIEWKRPKDITEEASFFVDGASCADVAQGKLGNCWFVAAAASLCDDRDLWMKVVPDHNKQSLTPENPKDYQGIFRFRFWRFGEWIEVVIDDRLPTINGELVYVKSHTRNEFWSALLEKAYAKLAGSYEALDSGNPADALVDFTGGVAETIHLDKKGYAESHALKKVLHKRLSKLLQRNAICSASITVTDRDEIETSLDNGLVKGHAYSIIGVKTVEIGESFPSFFKKSDASRVFLVKLRNPWGKKEWKGPWSDESEEWNQLGEEQRSKLDIKVKDDGEFWMCWDDFCSHFTTCVVCALVNTAVFTLQKTYHESCFKSRWKGKRAGGCANNKESFFNNPQYMFDIPGNKTDVAFVSLMQPDTRHRKHHGEKNHNIGLTVMKVEANRDHRIHYFYEKVGDSKYINSREVFVRLELDPGRYVIVPTTFEKGVEGDFLLRIYTDEANNMKELVTDAPNTRRVSCLPIWRAQTTQMSVIVTEVRDLIKKGNVSKSLDPYCIIECEGTRVTTPTIKDCANPKFNYGGLFYVSRPETATLRIQVWDKNVLMPDTFLGHIATYVRPNNKMMLHTVPLMEKISKDHKNDIKASGTISFKLAVSKKVGFM